MFWNNFLVSHHIDVLLQMNTVKLSDIIFEEDLLQELKTSNTNLTSFLTKPEVLTELIDNITQLTEQDCCDKSLYSPVHAAYTSCEILASGSAEILTALINHPQALDKIVSCSTVQPKQRAATATIKINSDAISTTESDQKEQEERLQEIEPYNQQGQSDQQQNHLDRPEQRQTNQLGQAEKLEQSDPKESKQEHLKREHPEPEQPGQLEQEQPKQEQEQPEQDQPELDQPEQDQSEQEHPQVEPEQIQPELLEEEQKKQEQAKSGEQDSTIPATTTQDLCNSDDKVNENNITSNNHDDNTELSSNHLTNHCSPISIVIPQKATLISKLISAIHSMAPSNLSCYISQNIETFSRLIDQSIENIDISGSFEILSTFIRRIRPEVASDLRPIFCEILSKLNFVQKLIDTMTLSEVEDKQRNACQLLCDIIVTGRQEVRESINSSGPIYQDMLAEYLESTEAVHLILEQMRNPQAIICGMKVLQTLLTCDAPLAGNAIKQSEEEIEKSLVKFHELLLDPPKQEPIKTTFGIIQKPLGYMRLEVLNLIKAFIGTNSPIIIRKLVELTTMKVVIDLFIEYSWNNLLHTQVEQALCLIIKNNRHDEESLDETNGQPQARTEQPRADIPSRALLSQLLNECDLIGRLLLPNNISSQNCEQANYGHIVQMINSIAINGDLDTIRDHLNEMKDKRPELYDRWTKFVNVDVASFKEISQFYDAQSANNNVNHRYTQQHHQLSDNQHLLISGNTNSSSDSEQGDDQFLAYFSFSRETVLPTINVDVYPKWRRPKNVH